MILNTLSKFAAALALTASAMHASAAVTPTQLQSVAFATLDASTVLMFNGFNATLGILTGVTVSLSGTETLFNQVTANAGAVVSVGNPTPLTATATTTVTGPSALSLVTPLSTPGFTGSITGQGALTPIVVGTATLPVTGSTTLASGLNAYIGGPASVAISIASVGSQGGTVPRLVFTGNDGNANINVSLFYTFTPAVVAKVPVPGSLALLGLGVLGLGFARRRKA